MVTTQTYYLTAILALVLSGISLAIGLANLIISQRNRLVDASEKKDSRAAEQAYKYSKEVQVSMRCFTSCADTTGCFHDLAAFRYSSQFYNGTYSQTDPEAPYETTPGMQRTAELLTAG
ncbi:TPA: hypothetical protein ACH3X2_010956 [Trebouxia sp. C0005]